jgi:hypothetical protein
MTIVVPAAHARQLDDDGYVRLEGFMADDRRRRLVERIDALFAAEGEAAGAEFRQERERAAWPTSRTKAPSSSTAWSTRPWARISRTSWARASSSAA